MFELFGSLRRADDNEYLAGGVHDVRVEGAELVDVQDAGDLGHESFDEAEVAADDPDDRRDGLDVVLVARRRGAARVRASSSPSRSASRRIQRLVLVGEADPATATEGELGLLMAGIGNQKASGPGAAGQGKDQ